MQRLRGSLARLARGYSSQPAFNYEALFQSTGPLPYPMRKLSSDYVSSSTVNGKEVLSVEPEALRLLASSAMVDIAHLLRPGHLQQLRNILDDPEASSNDKFVALELLKNANVASSKVLPGCQDTGTAIVMGKRGQYVWTDGRTKSTSPAASSTLTPAPTSATRRWRRWTCTPRRTRRRICRRR